MSLLVKKLSLLPATRVGIALFIFCIAFFRNPAVLIYPMFWAEDGPFFFKQSLELGISSLWTPVIGHYHTIPRIIAYAATFFPIVYAPLLYALGAGLLSAWIFSSLSKPGYRWLVANDGWRIFFAVLAASIPGTNETFWSLCTFNYTIYLWIFILLLEKDDRQNFLMNPTKFAIISFLWLSAGQGLVLAPLLLFLFWRSKEKLYALLLLSLGASSYLNILASRLVQNEWPTPSDPLAILPEFTLVFFDNFFLRYFYLPLLGQSNLISVMHLSPTVFLGLSLGLMALIIFAIAKLDKSKNWQRLDLQVLALASLLFAGTFLLVAWVRHRYGLGFIQRPTIELGGRHSLMPSFVALSLLALMFGSWFQKPSYRWLKIIFVIVLLRNLYSPAAISFRLGEKPETYSEAWPAQAAAIDNALALKTNNQLTTDVIVGPIILQPGDWKVSVEILKNTN